MALEQHLRAKSVPPSPRLDLNPTPALEAESQSRPFLRRFRLMVRPRNQKGFYIRQTKIPELKKFSNAVKRILQVKVWAAKVCFALTLKRFCISVQQDELAWFGTLFLVDRHSLAARQFKKGKIGTKDQSKIQMNWSNEPNEGSARYSCHTYNKQAVVWIV